MISGASCTSTCWDSMMNTTTEDHDDHHVHVHGNSSSSAAPESCSESSAASLFYSFSILKEKVHQVQSLVSLLLSTDQTHQPPHHDSTSIVIASMSNVIQELIVTASSMMFNCQQMSLGQFSATPTNDNNTEDHHQRLGGLNKVSHHPNKNIGGNGVFYSGEMLKWFGDDQNYNPTTTTTAIGSTCNIKENNNNGIGLSHGISKNVAVKESSTYSALQGFSSSSSPKNNNYEIIELDVADLLAKFTHYCQVCGKGFKRDANLRMHMRAHGDEYKTSASLSNPMKNVNSILMENDSSISKEDSNNSMKLLLPRKYSCPQEGCRWNKKHAKFQPLKSVICVKNHYKRSHCPKMYVCKRCNRKQFSVLSDLRTHEKHCGDLKWQCSCGTTFSRKDKLMGHVALFIGHTPVPVNNISAVTVTTTNKPGKIISTCTDHNQSSSSSQMQLDSR
ncbi:hypothetical protein FNV43_RR05606 [Rhamnella rubrinervis]|uniref:C2H2-type domain-containing protein n=1 Tax=Rhamnella rubrinervis TaxID=2594499 RepID=A0A8K0HPA8_9ROSA|nr:hypothetical protein FNV43_RR05606 [Rhamnella rubrinervis]